MPRQVSVRSAKLTLRRTGRATAATSRKSSWWRGCTALGQGWLSLDRDLMLPDIAQPAKRAWPPHEVPLGVLLAEQMKMRGYG